MYITWQIPKWSLKAGVRDRRRLNLVFPDFMRRCVYQSKRKRAACRTILELPGHNI